METKKLRFNRNPLYFGQQLAEFPSQDVIKHTPALFRASLEDAATYGGDLTRAALSLLELAGGRKHVLVDVKVHMLMPGMLPAIPGWHTDGVPRPNKDRPDIWLQEEPERQSSIYHLLVTGKGCRTEFLVGDVELDIPVDPTPDLYQLVDKQLVDQLAGKEPTDRLPLRTNNTIVVPPGYHHIYAAPACRMLTWDWWQLHRAIPALYHEWRYILRVTETDFIAPVTDLREVLRNQQQVYVPHHYGW